MSSDDELQTQTRVWPLVVAFAAGYAYGKYRVFRADIDEYHALRMEWEDAMDELTELIEDA